MARYGSRSRLQKEARRNRFRDKVLRSQLGPPEKRIAFGGAVSKSLNMNTGWGRKDFSIGAARCGWARLSSFELGEAERRVNIRRRGESKTRIGCWIPRSPVVPHPQRPIAYE